jgi:hypothetical protein
MTVVWRTSYVEVSFEQLARDRFASIHLVAEKGSSRKSIYSVANHYALRAGQLTVTCPNRRGGQHHM